MSPPNTVVAMHQADAREILASLCEAIRSAHVSNKVEVCEFAPVLRAATLFRSVLRANGSATPDPLDGWTL